MILESLTLCKKLCHCKLTIVEMRFPYMFSRSFLSENCQLQSCAKLVGTLARIFVIALIIKRCVCVKASMFKAHFLNLLPPPPAPTKQCWGTNTPPSFTVYHHCQHCFRGAWLKSQSIPTVVHKIVVWNCSRQDLMTKM